MKDQDLELRTRGEDKQIHHARKGPYSTRFASVLRPSRTRTM